MDALPFATACALGLILSIATGLRAFLAPFALATAGYLGLVDLGPSMHWLATPAAVVTFASAIVFELASDKIPALDHAMDVLHVALKPAAGALVGAAFASGSDPLYAGVAAVASGGVIAGATHFTKAAFRLGSTCTTGGTCNPLVSFAEDAVAIGLGALATWGVTAL